MKIEEEDKRFPLERTSKGEVILVLSAGATKTSLNLQAQELKLGKELAKLLVTYNPPSVSGSLRTSSRTMLAAYWAYTCDRRATSPSWSPPLIVIRCVTRPLSSGFGSN